jgi:hypothetical protein
MRHPCPAFRPARSAGRFFPDGKLKQESQGRQDGLRSGLHIGPIKRKGDLPMRKTLTLLVASTALTAVIGTTAWSAMHAPADGSPRPFAAIFEDSAQTMPLVLASDDDDDRSWRDGSRRGDDEDDDDDDCEDGDDDDDCRGGASNPAPSGTVAPPQNGLFGSGAPPQVQVN